MRFVEKSLGFSTADGEGVTLRYDDGDLHLQFTDWREQHVIHVFREVLAFRWQQSDESAIRNDQTYEVLDSDWLARQCKLHAVPAEDFVHYKLCFNAAGALDVITRVEAI